MNLDSLKKLYVHELKDLYSAESQLLSAIPGLIEQAEDDDLKMALQDQYRETRAQIDRLEVIFKGLTFSPRGHHCKGMEGLLAEAKELLTGALDDTVRDAALVSAAQRMAHYAIAGYGTARTYASKLGEYEAVDLLQETLEEAGATDRKLTRLAERRLNFVAAA